MGRRKKMNSVQVEEEEKIELGENMSQEATLDSLQSEIDLARGELEKTKIQIEEKKLEIQTMARRDIDAEEMRGIEKQITRGNERKASENIIEKQKEYDNEKVTGKFFNRRAPGQPAKLTYHKYVDDPVKWYDFQDGKIYTIPRGFADQINEHYYTPKFMEGKEVMDSNLPSSSIKEIDTSNKKYAFVPVNF